MPPKQCPECGRFLRNDFVTALATAPAPCPRCGTELTEASLDADEGPAPITSAPPATPTPAAPVESAGGEASVRPPDVDTSRVAAPADDMVVDVTDEAMSVRPPDSAPDVLAGWDPDGYAPRTLDDLRAQDRTPQLAAAGAAAGLVAGLLFLSGRRGRGALLGGLAGALAGVAAARFTRDQS